MDRSTIIGAAAGFAGALVIGTVAVANAGVGGSTPTPGPTQGAEGQEGWGGPRAGGGMPGRHGGMPGMQGRHGQGEHTTVTGDELAKVKAAVTAKDPKITVTEVRKDADGSYDAMGTKDGAPVHVELSKDLGTVEVRDHARGGEGTGDGPRGGHGMPGMTQVDAATLAKVKSAVTAKDAAVAVERVMQLPDGSYGAMGTKSGQRVMVHVSKDLTTVEVVTGRGPRHGGDGPRGGSSGPSGSPTSLPAPGPTA